MRPPIKIHGGKFYLAPWIIDHFPPDNEYITYGEPYLGGGNVLLRKRRNGHSEVVGDIDCNLTIFWKVLQNDRYFQQFRRFVEATPFSNIELETAMDGILENIDMDPWSIRAWQFFIVARMSRQGLRKDFATMSTTRTRRGMNEQAASWWSSIDGLDDVRERLKGVVILRLPAPQFIKALDGPDTFFYLDPPYMHEARVTTQDYTFEMDEAAHVELLETLSSIQGKFLLSGYASALYNECSEHENWFVSSKEIDAKSSSAKSKGTRVERLWRNYEKTNAA